MRTLKSLCRNFFLLVLSSVFFFAACKKKEILKEAANPDAVSGEAAIQWNDLLYQFDLGSNIIIVQKDGSIQDALHAAMPGDAIYIEPGIYREAITIDKPGIKLIGLNGTGKEQVILDNPVEGKIVINKTGNNVELINIQVRNFNEKMTNVSLLKLTQLKKKQRLLSIDRNNLGNGIAHYEFKVCLGHGQFDVVRIHRVVREHRPYHPVRTKGDVFMVHGASQDFDDIFLTAGSPVKNAQTSSPVYLASKDIDVWGIDLAWTLVPEGTSDFSFMKDWGVERDVDHTLAAMSIARLIRGLTKQGFARTHLLGFSYGATVAYTAAGLETRQHPILRDIKGIIPVDGGMKYAEADEVSRLSACAQAAGIKIAINNGIYQNSQGINFAPFGILATTAPGDPSTRIPGLTNYQAGLFVGTNTYVFPNPLAPFWHFMGGDLSNPAGIPNGLLYSEPPRWFQLLKSLAPYQPQLTVFESRSCQCDDEDVSIDDHLANISVPILYLGAGGGLGTFGDYTNSLTASNDITNYTVSLQPVENRFKDYGHADLFMGNNASNLVWEKLRQWLVSH